MKEADSPKDNKKKKYFEYYMAERSHEFSQRYSEEQSWKSIQQKILRKQIRRISIYGLGVSAALFLLVIGIPHFLSFYTHTLNNEATLTATLASFPEAGSRKATLTLDDGTRIDLSAQKGIIDSTNNNVAIHNNANHLLTYQKNNDAKFVVKPNILTVPRGGEYQLILSDGTRIWINAESSLRYPTMFVTDKREVFLEGEAFFEVAKDASHPFIVHTVHHSVEALGTSFNISAYPQSDIYTTLSEGKVKVSTEQNSVILTPDQQAIINFESNQIVTKEVSAYLYTSWAKGSYEFRNTTLQEITAQLSRWYDIDILFRNDSLKEKRFAGIIFRNEQLSFAIEIIEKVSNVHFVREGNVIYIENTPPDTAK